MAERNKLETFFGGKEEGDGHKYINNSFFLRDLAKWPSKIGE